MSINPAVLNALPEVVEFVLISLAAVVLFFVYDEVIRPWWRRGFGR